MGRTKAELVQVATEKYGIKNAQDVPYKKLEALLKAKRALRKVQTKSGTPKRTFEPELYIQLKKLWIGYRYIVYADGEGKKLVVKESARFLFKDDARAAAFNYASITGARFGE